MIRKGDFVLLVSEEGKEFLLQVDENKIFGTHKGNINLQELIGKEYGITVYTTKGSFAVVRPTIYDFIKRIKRQTQIIYPKDIGYIILRLGITSGSRVIECGTGSGSLATAFAFAVKPFGRVYSYEKREEFQKLAMENLKRAGVEDYVVLKLKDAREGFDEKEVDAIFIDVKVPEELVDSVWESLKPGAPVGFLLPTANQASSLLRKLNEGGFVVTELVEILLRRYKTNPERLRPDDLMNAHTGYLLFARKKEK